jgi:nitroreductase
LSAKSVKHAKPDHPIQLALAERWSPYVFSGREVSVEDLKALFEAARWAASSFNEQPWRYVAARRSDEDDFKIILSCLTEKNQVWARHAAVLALGLAKKTFTKTGKPNRVSHHDLGAASASLTVEATARGLSVHQMAGVHLERAHEMIGATEDFEVVTGIAIGYPGGPADGDPGLREKDAAERTRRPLAEFVFGPRFGESADWIK